jgi:hypothetical protein
MLLGMSDLMRLPLLLLLFFGTLYALTIPLFEAPDEPAHFARAYGISEGQFVLRDSPRHLTVFISEKLRSRQHQEKIVSIIDQLLRDFPDRIPQIAINTAMYSPVPYIFNALVIKTVTSFGESNFLLTLSIYLCRLTSLFLFISVLYLFSRMAPFAFWPVFWVCATPMALSQAAVVSVDFVILGACLILLAASLGDLKFQVFTWWVTTSGFLLLLTKPPYAPMLMIPLVPALFIKNATRQQRLAALSAVLLIPFLGAVVWNGLMVSQGSMNDFSALLWKYANIQTDPLGQLDYIKAHPMRFIQIIWNTLRTHGISYFHQFVGVLGWQNVPIPFWTALLWGLLAIPAVGVADLTGFKFQIRFLLGITCIVVSVLLIISISASAYMVWMPIAADWINLQGRYFHPVAVVCFTGVALIIPAGVNKKLRNVLHPLLLGAACLIHMISLLTVWQYYL